MDLVVVRQIDVVVFIDGDDDGTDLAGAQNQSVDGNFLIFALGNDTAAGTGDFQHQKSLKPRRFAEKKGFTGIVTEGDFGKNRFKLQISGTVQFNAHPHLSVKHRTQRKNSAEKKKKC